MRARAFDQTSHVAGILLLVASFLFVGFEAQAQAVLNPNQIRGSIEFTNQNPQILDVLDSAGLNSASIRADSVDSALSLNHRSRAMGENSKQMSYELSVESCQKGIHYETGVTAFLDYGAAYYKFEPRVSGAIKPEPQPDTTVDFKECAGLLDIRWVNAEGEPTSITSGTADAYFAKGHAHVLQARDWRFRNRQREFLTVRGDGTEYRVDVRYEAGNDPANKIHHLCRQEVTVSCDEVVKITCQIPNGGELGAIAGTIDMVGEEENRSSRLTQVRAYDGPFKNKREALVSGSGPFYLQKMVPSDIEAPAKGYTMFGQMSFGKGYNAQYFRTPILSPYFDSAVMVEGGQTTDLGDTFVMKPGFVAGEILLAGPPASTSLDTLYRDADRDRNGDGIPDNLNINGSSVGAWGSTRVAEGARRSAWGAQTRAGFDGEFNADSHSFEGKYRLALGGLHGEPSVWRANSLVLSMQNTSTPQDPESYLQSALYIGDWSADEIEVIPGETTEIDQAYCMNDVKMSFHTSSGKFFRPLVRAHGNFFGTDFRGNEVRYNATLSYAHGTPTAQHQAAKQGLVMMSLPQGSYTMTPIVTALNPNGGTSTTELRPIDVELGCRQVVSLTPDIQVNLEPLPQCTDDPHVTLAGSSSSGGEITKISYSLNGSGDVELCSNCGKDAEFSSEITIDECHSEIEVTAVDEFGEQASVQAFIKDDEAPIIEGCEHIKVQAAEGESGAEVFFDVGATDSCHEGPQVVCDATSGDFFTVGEHQVTCTATDACENQRTCDFSITVFGDDEEENACIDDTVPPIVECSIDRELLWPPNHKMVRVGLDAAAKDNCSEEGATELPVSTTVWSDETEVPEPGDGSGNFAPDAKNRDGALRLRSERRGTEDGRVYLTISEAEDTAGNMEFACCTVVVPHDNSSASHADVLAQADEARAFCEEFGIAPPGFSEHGVSSELQPKKKNKKQTKKASSKKDKKKKAKKNKKKKSKKKKKRSKKNKRK